MMQQRSQHRSNGISQIGLQNGFTLIEVIIVIVATAILMGVILRVFDLTAARSADPLLRNQATAIAQGYLEEALLKAYADPETETGTCEEGASNRANFDDANDYACINDTAGAEDQFGNAYAGLNAYNVQVNVTDVNLGSGGNQAPARRIEVIVTHDAMSDLNLRLYGYRAQVN